MTSRMPGWRTARVSRQPASASEQGKRSLRGPGTAPRHDFQVPGPTASAQASHRQPPRPWQLRLAPFLLLLRLPRLLRLHS
eukprot:2215889-Rhodomonas_salina.1